MKPLGSKQLHVLERTRGVGDRVIRHDRCGQPIPADWSTWQSSTRRSITALTFGPWPPISPATVASQELILVTPFNSIVELASDHYPWLPVRLLLRHRMPTVDFVRDMPTPTALIVAGSDTIVPPGRSEPLRRAISNLVSDAKIDEAGHNDLFDRAAFREALREALARIEAIRQR